MFCYPQKHRRTQSRTLYWSTINFMSAEGFRGFPKAQVLLGGELEKGAVSSLSLETLQGPLVESLKTFSPEQLNVVDARILNENSLSPDALGWVKDPTRAEEIFRALQTFLLVGRESSEHIKERRAEAKRIAEMIEDS